MNFFGAGSEENDYSKDHERLPNVMPWPEAQMLAFEKQVLGFYVTSNPLSHCAEKIDFYSTVNSSELAGCGQDNEVVIGGMITKTRYHITKKGRNAGAQMVVFILEDLQGEVEVVLFPEALKRCGQMLGEDKVVFVRGKVDCRREKPNIFADELIDLDEVTEKLAARVRISLDSKDITKEKIAVIKNICQNHRGKSPVCIVVNTEKGKINAAADKKLAVNPDVDFCREIKQVVGQENLQLVR